MNEKNVEALTELCDEALNEGLDSHPRSLARFLVERGVLVPGALTEEEIWRLLELATKVDGVSHTSAEAKTAYSAELERIARGDLTSRVGEHRRCSGCRTTEEIEVEIKAHGKLPSGLHHYSIH